MMLARLYSSKKPNRRDMALVPAWQIFASASLLIVCAFVSTAQGVVAKPGQKEWILRQASDMGGDTTIYFTDDAVKVQTEKLGCNLLCRAPDWKVHCYQPKESLEWVGDLSLFSGIVMGNPYALPKTPRVMPAKLVGTGDFKGLKYSKYRSSMYGNRKLCVADDIPLAPKAAEFLSRLYTMPVITKVPVFCSGSQAGAPLKVDHAAIRQNDYDCAVDLRKGDVQYLRTVSWKSMPYNAADFAAPKNFKRVSDIIQVTFSSDKKDQLGDMLDNVGFTTESSKSGAKKK